MMTTDDLLALVRKHNAKVCDVPYDGITFTRSQLQRFVADLQESPAPVGRAVDRSGDLVPLANGRSVDLGGRWTMPT